MMTKGRQPTGGFTLIELLVIIAIIGLLISLGFGALGKARTAARNVQCTTNLRSIASSYILYVQEYRRFPELNNDPDEGSWQYNYLIFDGRDLEQNFGPLVHERRWLSDVRTLFCPLQTDPHHGFATPENPWPSRPLLDTRAGYGRRYHLSGKMLSQIKGSAALAADLIHLPAVVKSAHKTGVNAAYFDGHTQRVLDNGKLTDNELSHPFDPMDNPIIEDIWELLDKGKR